MAFPLEIPYLQDVAKTVLFRYSHEEEPMTRYGKAAIIASQSGELCEVGSKELCGRDRKQKRGQGSEANMSR